MYSFIISLLYRPAQFYNQFTDQLLDNLPTNCSTIYRPTAHQFTDQLLNNLPTSHVFPNKKFVLLTDQFFEKWARCCTTHTHSHTDYIYYKVILGYYINSYCSTILFLGLKGSLYIELNILTLTLHLLHLLLP